MELWISTNCTIQGIHRLRKGKIAKEQKESELEQKLERGVYLNELAERIAAQ